MTFSRLRLAIVIPALLAAASCRHEVFPGQHWRTMTPAEAGLDAAALDRLRDYMQGRGCIVRHGCMVYTWGDAEERGDVASAAKPWYSFFLFKAIEEGRLAGVDEKVSGYVPCLESLNAGLGFKDRGQTFRHLATQTSCYGVSEAPGTAFDYNDWQMALLVDTLFLGVYGAAHTTMDDNVLHPILSDVLQCEDNPTLCAFGADHHAGRLAVSPRDFCRFGYLYLHEGRWKGRQVLSKEHVRMCTTSPLPGSFPRTQAVPAEMCPDQRSIGSERVPDNQCDHEGSYSWLWWTNGVNRNGERHWPDAPTDAYAALGHRNGMRGMAVIPSLDIVLSWNDTALGDMKGTSNPLDEAFRLLRDAVLPEPMAGQVMADPAHPAWLVRNEDKNLDGRPDPFFMCGPGDPEGFLYRGTRNVDGTRNGDQAAIIGKMTGTGANCIYVQAIRSHGGDGDAMHNPFVDSDPAKGLDENILQQWETWFREMDDNGIVVFFIFYDDNASIWPTGDAVGPEERLFLEQTVRRFAHHRSLIWCVAEEYGEAFSPARVSNIASVIHEADKHRHVIAVHKNESLTFDEFAGDSNIGQFAVQYNRKDAATLHDGMLAAWRNAGGRYNLNMAEADKFGFGAAAREKSWACAMGGAYVMALGWSFDKPDTPSVEDLKACGNLVRFFESTNVNEMAPHDELRAAGTQYVLAAPGQSYIAYASQPGGAVGLKSIKEGVYRLTWFNPVSGKSVTQDRVRVSSGEQHWERPRDFAGPVALYVRNSGAICYPNHLP
jgi:CubicO group peptidase (beta-lactamase class C family)